MRKFNQGVTKRIVAIVLATVAAFTVMGCKVEKTVTTTETHTDANGNTVTTTTTQTTDQNGNLKNGTAVVDVEPAEEESSLIYEAFFLDNDEVMELFTKVRGEEAPYENITKDFHVTTAFMPEQDMHELYGTEVTIHIYGYKNGEVVADDGSTTANEGFFCKVTSDNEEMQSFIDNTEKNWHITGSYKDAAKYTEYIDPSDAAEVDFTVKGRFGAGMSNGDIMFENK